MSKTLMAILMLGGLGTAAAAQDGGKLDWRGKDKDDPKTAMADAKRQGKAMMVFFTSLG